MTTLPGRLGSLTASDVMTQEVVVISNTDSIQQAVGVLRKHRITGAPVVDAAGRPVGMLSISDVIAAMQSEEEPAADSAQGDDQTAWELFGHSAGELKAEETVAERMSRQLVSVSHDTPLVEVARVMCGGHWHRLTVTDSDGSVCGIVSTMDLLAAVVNTADEAK